MTDFVVGARFEVKTNELVAAAKAGEEQLAKLRETAARADQAVDAALSPPAGGKALAAEIAQIEAQLGRFLARVDPAARALKTQAEGHALLGRALELGVIGQKEYEAGLARVTKAADAQLLTQQNLLKGHLTFHQSLRAGTALLGGMVGGLAGSLAGMLANEAGALALAVATQLLGLGTSELTKAEEELARVLKMSGDEVEKEKQSAATRLANARAIADAKRKEAEAILAKVEALRAEAIAQDTLQTTMSAGPIDAKTAAAIEARAGAPYDAAMARARAALAIDYYTKQPYDDALLRRQRADDNAREAERERLFREFRRRFNPDPGKGGAARAGGADGAREFQRQVEAIIKGRQALEEYAAATLDVVEKAAAEFSGRRELIAQIELEAQLRRRFGVEFVAQNRDRIAALAAERAAAQRLSDQYKATAQFLESSAERLGDVIQATLVLSFDQSADAARNWESAVVSSLRQVAAELQRLAITNPLLNFITGQNTRPTAYGPGGLFGVAMDALFRLGGGEIGGRAAVRHGGGLVDQSGPSRWLPDAVFRAAPRAHEGLMLGPRERPVIALDGEGIFTPRAMQNADRLFAMLAAIAARGAEGGGVTILDQRGAQAPPIETRRRRGAGGRIETLAIVKADVKQAFADGALDAVMMQRYGIAVRGTRS